MCTYKEQKAGYTAS